MFIDSNIGRFVGKVAVRGVDRDEGRDGGQERGRVGRVAVRVVEYVGGVGGYEEEGEDEGP